MQKILDPRYDFSALQCCRILLPVIWFAGLLLGIAFARCSDSFSSLMRGAVLSDVSIVSLATVILLPYLLTVVAVLISQPWLILLIAFGKAFAFGSCSFAIEMAFVDSGWLVRAFLLFSDWACVPVLYRLWNRCFHKDQERLSGSFVMALMLLLFLGSIDRWIVAPFLTMVR